MNFKTIRDPLKNEVQPGDSKILIGLDEFDRRWVIRESLDEVFCWAMADNFFGSVVPFTVQNGPESSAQIFITGQTAHQLGSDLYNKVRQSLFTINSLANLVCFDYVLRNQDRHGNNWLIADDNLIYGIDNHFGPEPISFRQALRPAFRCLLIDDPEFTPALIARCFEIVSGFVDRSHDDWMARAALGDIYQWKADLSRLHGI